MESDQSVHRFGFDHAHVGESEHGCRLAEYVGEGSGHTSGEVYGQAGGELAVWLDVAFEEQTEFVGHDAADFGVDRNLLADERHQRCKPCVDAVAAVDVAYDLAVGHAGEGFQLFAHGVGYQALVGGVYHAFAYGGAAAFVTEDESERGNVVGHFLAVVVACVGSGAENGHESWLVAAQCSGCPEQVGVHFHHLRFGAEFGHGAAESPPYLVDHSGVYTAGSVVVYGTWNMAYS